MGSLAVGLSTVGVLAATTGPVHAASPAPSGIDQVAVWRSAYATLNQASTLTGKWRTEPAGLSVDPGATPDAAVDAADGEEYVVWADSAGNLWLATDRNRAWTEQRTGVSVGIGSSAPAIAVDDKGTVSVVWRTAADALATATDTAGTWSPVTTAVTLDPAAAPSVAMNPATGRMNVVWADSLGRVWRANGAPSAVQWQVQELPAPADPTGEAPTSRPTVADTAGGVVTVVWRDADNALFADVNAAGRWTGTAEPVLIRAQSSGPQVAAAGGETLVAWANATGTIWEATGANGAWTTASDGVSVPSGARPALLAWRPTHAPALRSDIVGVAESQMGYRDPANQGFCNKYSFYWGVGYGCRAPGTRDEEWCADFAKWVWGHAGAEVDGNLTPSAASFHLWAVANGRWHSASSGYVPQPGDAVVYGLDKAGTWAAHVAIVVGSTKGLPDVVNGDFGYGVSGVVPMEVNENVISTSDIAGYATPMPAGSHAAAVRYSANLQMGTVAGRNGH